VAVHGLKHPNIVRAIDMDPYGDPPYLVMEYVEGPSLREAIDEYEREFPVDAAVSIMRGVLQALAVAHDAGLVHRDIKPANLLLNHPLEELSSITEQAVKVTDFGLGRIGGLTTHSIMQSGSLLTEEGRSVAGTLAYMSPEQKEGREVDARSDLFSCGIVLFEMLTGERPQGGDMPSMVRREVPRFLDEVFRQTYTRSDRRYGSAREMLAALTPARASTGEAPAVSGPTWVPSSGELSCPACKMAVHPDDQFCIRCGRQLAASVPRCPNPECRAFVHSADRYCIFCGTSLQVLTE
jgi:serine/threonine-protein kinase